MTTENTKKKYTFQTIVVPAWMRAEFTLVREDLQATDKQLALAMWNLVMRDPAALALEVANLKELAAQLKQVAKITTGEAEGTVPKAARSKKAVAKKAPKKEKVVKEKKEKAPKAPKKTVMFEGREESEEFAGVDDDGDFQPLIVNGL
jgi:hypothetical protein